jgi:hypothetical protein
MRGGAGDHGPRNHRNLGIPSLALRKYGDRNKEVAPKSRGVCIAITCRAMAAACVINGPSAASAVSPACWYRSRPFGVKCRAGRINEFGRNLLHDLAIEPNLD